MDDFIPRRSHDQNLNYLNTFQSEEQYRSNKKFKCRVCSKYLSSKHCLKEHNYTHTNEKPYSCVACNRYFKHASQLSLHKKTHQFEPELFWPKLTYLISLKKPSLPLCDAPIEKINLPAVNSNDQVWHLPNVVSSYY